jgi:hypothetical protein
MQRKKWRRKGGKRIFLAIWWCLTWISWWWNINKYIVSSPKQQVFSSHYAHLLPLPFLNNKWTTHLAPLPHPPLGTSYPNELSPTSVFKMYFLDIFILTTWMNIWPILFFLDPTRWPKFAIEPYNVRLGLTTDGVNLYNEKSSIWSTWLIVFFNYNLPPWLVIKFFFIMLTLIIPRKESMKMHNISMCTWCP